MGQKIFLSPWFKIYCIRKNWSLFSLLTILLCIAGFLRTWGGRGLPSSCRSSTEWCGCTGLSRGSAVPPSPSRLLLGACLLGGFTTRYTFRRVFAQGTNLYVYFCDVFVVAVLMFVKLTGPQCCRRTDSCQRALLFKAVQAKNILLAAPHQSS